jgi:glutaredoxin-like protein NrdH
MGAAHEVRVFGRKGCVQCTATYRALDDRGITYEVVDVDELREGAVDELRALGFTQLPVVQAPGMAAWSGFRPDRIDAIVSEAAA